MKKEIPLIERQFVEDMEKVKVSIVVPVYNAQKYLKQCVESICNQTLKEIEIILVDDGSTDDSLCILQELAKQDGRIIVIEQNNAGAGAARNKGLAIAKGEYLLFLDADDFFETTMLEKAYAKALEDDSDFVVFRADQYYTEEQRFAGMEYAIKEEELPPFSPFKYRQMTTNVFKVFIGWAWDKLYKKEFVDKHKLTFQEQRTTNDMLFVFSALVLAERISIVKEVLVHQRRDASDSLSKTREHSWHCFYEALKALKRRLEEEGLFGELQKDYINYALHFCLWNIDTLSEPTKTKLINKLREEWSNELGIANKGINYFYNKYEYKRFCKLIK